MLTFEFISGAGFGKALSLQELAQENHELWEFYNSNPGFVAIKFDKTSAVFSGRTILINKSEIKKISIK